MLRYIPLFALIAALAVPVAAQAQAPEGLKVRVDRSTNAEDPDDTPELKVMTMGKGFHVVGGPAGTFWDPKNTVAGNYTVKATFNLMEPSNHRNYYGIIFGGSDLEGAGQAYNYFMVAQTGELMIRTRTGEKVGNVHPARGGVKHEAVKIPGADGRSTNELEVRVAGDTVSYVVNGMVVHTMPKSGIKTDGIVGVRVNHMLNVHVDGFTVTKQ
jgi:hypothetical protein